MFLSFGKSAFAGSPAARWTVAFLVRVDLVFGAGRRASADQQAPLRRGLEVLAPGDSSSAKVDVGLCWLR